MEIDPWSILDALLGKGLSESEVEGMVKQKCNEFQGFLSNGAALLLVAKDYGLNESEGNFETENYQDSDFEVDYDEFSIPIKEVEAGMSELIIVGRIQTVYGRYEFTRKDGSGGRVGSFVMSDGTSSIKIVLWDDQTQILDSEYFKINELVRVIFGYSKEGREGQLEVHLSKKGKVILAPEDINPSKISLLETNDQLDVTPKPSKADKKNITSILRQEEDSFISLVEGIVSIIEPLRVITKKDGDKINLLKFRIRDGEASISVIVWGEQALECSRQFKEGSLLLLFNVGVKINSYTLERELSFNRKTTFQKF